MEESDEKVFRSHKPCHTQRSIAKTSEARRGRGGGQPNAKVEHVVGEKGVQHIGGPESVVVRAKRVGLTSLSQEHQ
jgi:hypothetical protein